MLDSKKISDKPVTSLGVLAKYFYSIGYDAKSVLKLLNDFMTENYKNYNPVRWDETLEKVALNAMRHTLATIKYIPITVNELTTISSIKNKRLERLAFTLLCLAKLANMKNEKNNDWVNRDLNSIFQMAHIQCTKNQKPLLINKLKTLGLIEYSRIVDNVNINVLYVDVDSNSEVILKIDDFRELGLEYEHWKSRGYIRCNECGLLIKRTSNKRCYCRECAKKAAQASKRQWDISHRF